MRNGMIEFRKGAILSIRTVLRFKQIQTDRGLEVQSGGVFINEPVWLSLDGDSQVPPYLTKAYRLAVNDRTASLDKARSHFYVPKLEALSRLIPLPGQGDVGSSHRVFSEPYRCVHRGLFGFSHDDDFAAVRWSDQCWICISSTKNDNPGVLK